MIFLWILAVLVILVVSIGQRASTTFRYIRYQRDRQKALYLAKAAINRVIIELDKDNNGYDALDDPWADNQEIFERVVLTDAENEFARVSYIREEKDKEEVKFGVVDEEGKLNINTASEELLIALLEHLDIVDAPQIARNIRIWRGLIGDDNGVYEELGYAPKRNEFSNTEELMLVKGITPQDYEKLKESITVYTDGLVNVNTCSDRILDIVARGVAKKLNPGEAFARSLTVKILAAKENNNGYFKEKKDVNVTTAGNEEQKILNALMQSMTTKSNNFFIRVTGKVGKIENKVSAVYNRKEKKFRYWHED